MMFLVLGLAGSAVGVGGLAATAADPGPWNASAGSELLLIDGTVRAAKLIECDLPSRMVVTVGGATETVALNRLIRWGRLAELPREFGDAGHEMVVCLGKSGWIVAEALALDAQGFRFKSPTLGSMSVPRSRVSGILFRPPGDPTQRDLLLDRAVRGEFTSERILLRNGDEAAGAVGSIDKDRLQCEMASQSVSVPVSRLVGILFRRDPSAEASVEAAAAMVGFGDGSRLATSAASGKGDGLTITPFGLPTQKAAFSDLVFLQAGGGNLQAGGGNVMYLSDRKPSVYRHVPFLSTSWPYRDDRNVLGGMLRVGGRTFLKGIGVHSAARLTYAIAESSRQFHAEVAVDDCADGGGSVRFRVFVDGQLKYTSLVVRGGEPPQPVRVDVSGAKRLELVVDFADRGDQCDRADWLDARFVR